MLKNRSSGEEGIQLRKICFGLIILNSFSVLMSVLK